MFNDEIDKFKIDYFLKLFYKTKKIENNYFLNNLKNNNIEHYFDFLFNVYQEIKKSKLKFNKNCFIKFFLNEFIFVHLYSTKKSNKLTYNVKLNNTVIFPLYYKIIKNKQKYFLFEKKLIYYFNIILKEEDNYKLLYIDNNFKTFNQIKKLIISKNDYDNINVFKEQKLIFPFLFKKKQFINNLLNNKDYSTIEENQIFLNDIYEHNINCLYHIYDKYNYKKNNYNFEAHITFNFISILFLFHYNQNSFIDRKIFNLKIFNLFLNKLINFNQNYIFLDDNKENIMGDFFIMDAREILERLAKKINMLNNNLDNNNLLVDIKQQFNDLMISAKTGGYNYYSEVAMLVEKTLIKFIDEKIPVTIEFVNNLEKTIILFNKYLKNIEKSKNQSVIINLLDIFNLMKKFNKDISFSNEIKINNEELFKINDLFNNNILEKNNCDLILNENQIFYICSIIRYIEEDIFFKKNMKNYNMLKKMYLKNYIMYFLNQLYNINSTKALNDLENLFLKKTQIELNDICELLKTDLSENDSNIKQKNELIFNLILNNKDKIKFTNNYIDIKDYIDSSKIDFYLEKFILNNINIFNLPLNTRFIENNKIHVEKQNIINNLKINEDNKIIQKI